MHPSNIEPAVVHINVTAVWGEPAGVLLDALRGLPWRMGHIGYTPNAKIAGLAGTWYRAWTPTKLASRVTIHHALVAVAG